jgi:pimeloyl-ACP methyl ester carboxylesterase
VATVTSRDGTTIGYDLRGDGPALVLIDGALGYRRLGLMSRLVGLLTPRLEVITYDRRGRGESGDTQPYALKREIEDIAALIEVMGGSASLCGMSSGACLALEAALDLGGAVANLAMYEPPYDSEADAAGEWQEYGRHLDELLANGRNGDAMALFMQFIGTPSERIEGMRQSPIWAMLEAIAPTLAHDKAAIGQDRQVPATRAAHLTIPTLVMNGTGTVPFIAEAAAALASAIPDGRHVTLEGQTHDVDPEVLAPVLIEFLGE